MMRTLGSTILILWLAVAAAAQSASTDKGYVFIVRHGEKVSETADELSSVGKQRAACLAQTLKDTNVKAVITSEANRTKQTAGPTAEEHHVTAMTVKAGDTAALVKEIAKDEQAGDVLVVGHSNTIPQLLNALTGKQTAWSPTEYDDLFVFHHGELLHLHYCPAGKPEKQDMK